MRNFRSSIILASALTLFSFSNNVPVCYAQAGTTVSEEAQSLYEKALDFQKKGKMRDAISSYVQALRKDRTVLAFDDNGLIDAAYADSVNKLKESPDDVKLLELCGFLSSVGFSDNATAITYYEKIVELVEDEGVKARTQNLIERLRATSDAQQAYDKAVASSLRDERIKTWSEMEKIDSFNEEKAKASDVAGRLKDAYSNRESLENKIPQLEEELKELQESYDKTDRLWYTLKDELYERRRRRLKNDLAAKKEELAAAKKELKAAEKEVANLEKLDEEYNKQQEDSAFNPSDDGDPEDEDSAFNSVPSKPSGNRNGNKGNSGEEGNGDYEDEYSEDALKEQADEMSEEERKEQLKDLIDNL